MYIKDALGRDLSIVKFTTVGATTTQSTEYFVYGTDRAARITASVTTLVDKIQPDEMIFFLYDHLGNNRVAFSVNSSNVPTIINAMDYYSYGKILREYDNGAGNRYLTTQHERDQKTGLDYRGARYYDSDIARFLSLDPLASKYPMLSAYNYVAGNPIIFIDPDGREMIYKGQDISSKKTSGWNENHVRLNETFGDPNGFNKTIMSSPEWASQKGFYVHQQANDYATLDLYIAGIIDYETSVLLSKQLDKATIYADGAAFQTSLYSYRHAMRNGKQSIEDAKSDADAFVRQRYQWARYEFDKGNTKKAFFILGVALHVIQDATSPAHGGFQEWTGDETKLEEIDHVTSEFLYPGSGSNLQKETYKFLELFFNGQELPSGNIFNSIQVDGGANGGIIGTD